MDAADRTITLIYLQNYLSSMSVNDNNIISQIILWIKNNKDELFTQDEQIKLANEIKKRKDLLKKEKGKNIPLFDSFDDEIFFY
jgi:hypothetical protein